MIREMFTEVKNQRVGELVSELFQELDTITKEKIAAIEASFVWKEEVQQLEEVIKNNEATAEQHERYSQLKQAFLNLRGRTQYVIATQNDCVSMLNKIFNMGEAISRVGTNIEG